MTDDTEACMGDGDLGEVLAQSLTDLSEDCILHEPVEQMTDTEDAHGAHLARVRHRGSTVGVGGLAERTRDRQGGPEGGPAPPGPYRVLQHHAGSDTRYVFYPRRTVEVLHLPLCVFLPAARHATEGEMK